MAPFSQTSIIYHRHLDNWGMLNISIDSFLFYFKYRSTPTIVGWPTVKRELDMIYLFNVVIIDNDFQFPMSLAER